MDEEPVHMTARQEERFYRTFWEFFVKTRGPLCNSCGHHQDWHLSYKCVQCQGKDAYHAFKPAPFLEADNHGNGEEEERSSTR